MKKLSAIMLSASMLCLSSQSYAFVVYSPYVEKGVVEIESRNRFDFDDRSSEDGFRQHKFAVEYGFTSMFKAALYGELEKDGGNGYKYAATEVETYFQLTEVGEYWADVGALVSYEFARPTGKSDKMEAFLLLAKNLNKYTVMANLGFEKEVGSRANKNPEAEVRLMGKYIYLPMLNPGVEYYAELGEIGNSQGYNNQKHRLGPVLYGKLGHGVKYELGALFGVSSSAEDLVLKFNIEYEFPL